MIVAGHLGCDVETAMGEGLAGHPDGDVAAAALAEHRCIVSFDLDFADPRKFPPRDFDGLVILRLRVPTARRQVERVTKFLAEKPGLAGHLWILEDTRARDWTP